VNAPELEGETIDMNDLTAWLRPAMHVHIGQSAQSDIFGDHFMTSSRSKPSCSFEAGSTTTQR